jgi:lipoprotein-anchoring transpeptidase ErfK/SrfK
MNKPSFHRLSCKPLAGDRDRAQAFCLFGGPARPDTAATKGKSRPNIASASSSFIVSFPTRKMNYAFLLIHVLRGGRLVLILTVLSLIGCSSFPELDTASLSSMTQSVPEFGRRSLNSVTRSVPELGMLTDQGTSGRSITVRLSDQRAFLYKRGEVVAISPASTGREGYNTPVGRHRVISKDIDHRSSIYGAYVRNGQVVKAGVDVRKDPKPPGAVFVGAPMPYYLQIAPSYGLHAGHVPGYPASHGCIRLPARWAKRFYNAVKVGTPVQIYR